MKRNFFLVFALALPIFALASCGKEPFKNPGDYLGGGGTGEIANGAEDVTDGIKDAFSDPDLSALSENTSAAGAVTVSPDEGLSTLSESGTYLFRGSYGGIALGADGLNLHLIFDGATIERADGVALDGSGYKNAKVVVTLLGENSAVSADGENGIHIKGALSFNGSGSLSVESGKNAVKVTKGLEIVDCSLALTAENHAISALSVSACDCEINVLSAGKDGINAECDDKTTAFTTDEGYVCLKNVSYTCETAGDGIQADTVVYIVGGTYDIRTNGVFVADTAANRADYELTADDFRYIKSGNSYQKVASDYRGGSLYALAQGCKGIKVGEIEYPDPNDEEKEITVTEGDYSVIIGSGTFTIDSSDDAIHANSGNLRVDGGTFTISTYDDALTSDVLTKITGGEITVTKSYEGIEGGYVEIAGGTVNITAQDDGINAASDDKSVTEHIIIAGGKVYVDAGGDGIDSNGTILISGGETYVAGPTSNMDASLDTESGGAVVTGGYPFAVGPLGMVETPAQNSTQCVLSFARNQSIAAGTNLTLTDGEGNTIMTFRTPKACQSVILSCPELEKGKSYRLYGGDSSLCEFTVESIITSVGSSGGIGNPGGNPSGGPGGRPSGTRPGGPWG